MAKKEAASQPAKKIRVTQLRSTAGVLAMHKNNLRGLGLRRRHHTVELMATPSILGMVRESAWMLKIEEV